MRPHPSDPPVVRRAQARYAEALDAAATGEHQRFPNMVARGVERRRAAALGFLHPTLCPDCTRSVWRCACPDPDLELVADGNPDGDPDGGRWS